MSEVDVALNDEGQQYGNLDEASAIARVPRKGLVVWCGDHKQTPGGLRKSDEARAGVLLSSKHCVKKPLAVAGMLALLRVAVQRLQCCGWRWPPKGSRYKLTLSAALQAQPGNKSGP